jgi:hypothetical protein
LPTLLATWRPIRFHLSKFALNRLERDRVIGDGRSGKLEPEAGEAGSASGIEPATGFLRISGQ